MMEHRNSTPAHVDWVKRLKALIMALGAFLKQHYPAGAVWNPSGISIAQFIGAHGKQ